MYMITDSLTCRPPNPPPERGAGAALGAVLLGPHKALLCPRRSMRCSTSEPAASWVTHGRLYRWSALAGKQPAAPAILHGLARRTAPQPQPPRRGSRARRWAAEESPAGAVLAAGHYAFPRRKPLSTHATAKPMARKKNGGATATAQLKARRRGGTSPRRCASIPAKAICTLLGCLLERPSTISAKRFVSSTACWSPAA